jgi:energy-converting hydrogenase A subunit M
MELKVWRSAPIVRDSILQDVSGPFADSFPVLAEEVEITMKMLGVSSLDQLRPDMVNASRLVNEMWRPDIWWNKSKL